MRSLVCVDERGWEAVVRGAARYLGERGAVVAHVIEEHPARGFELAMRGLLGRRTHQPQESMASAAHEAAAGLLSDATTLLRSLCPGLVVESRVLTGAPNEELMRAAGATGAEAIFVGRGTPGAHAMATVYGVVSGWTRNHHGDDHGLSLENGTEVRFPPHRAGVIKGVIREEAEIEAHGSWREHHLHAYSITDLGSGSSVEAHEPPGRGPGNVPLGHTARFVADHATCDVIVLS